MIPRSPVVFRPPLVVTIALWLSACLFAISSEAGWLGLKLRDQRGGGVDDPSSILVVDVIPAGPAERAGVQPGDIVTAIDGRPLIRTQELVNAVRPLRGGTRIHLDLRREGTPVTATVTLTEGPDTPAEAPRPSSTPTPRWTRVSSPQGRFTVELPEDWTVKPTEPDESSVNFSPTGRDAPFVTIRAWVTADVYQMMLTRQTRVDPRTQCQQIPALEFYRQIFLPLARQRVPGIRVERMTLGHSPADATVEGTAVARDQTYRFVDVVSMEYVSDDTQTLLARCPHTWFSFPFIRGLVAAPSEFDEMKPMAARILSSFTPTPAWGADQRATLFHAIDTRLRMIGRTLGNIQRMQMDQLMQQFESNRRIGQRWVDSLGGLSRWKDPTTSEEGTVSWGSMPSEATKWWRCPGRYDPVPSNTWPGGSCYEIPPPR